MYSKFSYASTSPTLTSGTQTISAAPTLLAEVGNYNIIVNACVTANPSSCAQCTIVGVTVINPCLTATVSSSTILNIDLYVYDPVATSNPFTSFTYTAGGSSTICGSLTYEVSLVLLSATTMISTFSLNSLAQTF